MTLAPEIRVAIDAALDRGDYPAAAAAAEAALAQGQADVMLFQLAAWAREEQGDLAGAHRALVQASKLAPGDPTILVEIAAIWRRAGEPKQALAILEAMVESGLDHPFVWIERGHANKALNGHSAANESYRRALAHDPRSPIALGGIADTALRLGDAPGAAEYAAAALAVDPDDIVALNVSAQADLQAKRYGAARDRLEAALARSRLPEDAFIETLTLLGDAQDALGAFDAAFASYSRAQAAYRRRLAPRFGDERRGQLALMNHVQRQLDRLDPANWRAIPARGAGDGAVGHVFLMGYPRSGTTLVENVLATLPEIVALEEKPLLAATEGPLLGSADGIARLGELGPAQAEAFRTAYWQAVAAEGAAVENRIFVEMNPLRAISLPITARLFPDARLVIMRRDPRDVVWSCFRRHFAETPTGYAFSDLESVARHYDALMRLTETGLAKLPVTAHILYYHELIADFDACTKALCAFVGAEWRPEVRAFDRTAARRGVTTASVLQVQRGLFDGTGRWRPYARHLAPILPILQPWIDRFGFEP